MESYYRKDGKKAIWLETTLLSKGGRLTLFFFFISNKIY